MKLFAWMFCFLTLIAGEAVAGDTITTIDSVLYECSNQPRARTRYFPHLKTPAEVADLVALALRNRCIAKKRCSLNVNSLLNHRRIDFEYCKYFQSAYFVKYRCGDSRTMMSAGGASQRISLECAN